MNINHIVDYSIKITTKLLGKYDFYWPIGFGEENHNMKNLQKTTTNAKW